MRYSCLSYQVTIYEHDDDGEHDHIKDLSGEVKKGKVAIPWKVEYHADDDDSNCAKEIAEQGYTVPEYFFVVEYNGEESEKGKLLYVKGWISQQIKEKDTGEIQANRKYTLITSSGDRLNGVTDENGYIKRDHESIKGSYLFYLRKEK